MKYTSCPGKDRKLLVIVFVGAQSVCFGEDAVQLRRLGYIDLFFAIPFWENFGRILIVADGFWDMLINSVLQS